MNANPCSDEKGEEFKKEFLILVGERFKMIKKINKDPVTKEDRNEALTEKETRIK